MNVLLTYYKCIDDWQDDHALLKKGYSLVLLRAGKWISKQYPDKADLLKRKLLELSEVETGQSENIEEAAGIFGEICGSLFVRQNDVWQGRLYNMGFYLGKFIYLMDAYDDYEKDRTGHHYNPFLTQKQYDFYRDIRALSDASESGCQFY